MFEHNQTPISPLPLMSSTLTILTRILNAHHNQKSPIVLRAWRVVQSTARIVSQADEEADLEALVLRVRWVCETVGAAVGRKPKAMCTGGGAGAIHPSLLEEADEEVSDTRVGIFEEAVGLGVDIEFGVDIFSRAESPVESFLSSSGSEGGVALSAESEKSEPVTPVETRMEDIVDALVKEKLDEETKVRVRDGWVCDFCGAECFCGGLE